MPIRKGGKRKVFQPMLPSEKKRLISALKNKSNITAQQIADAAGLSKAEVIDFCKRTGIRNLGSEYRVREIKQPKIDARLKLRALAISEYYRKCNGNVSVNELQKLFGGEKKFIKKVIENI